MPGFIMVNGQAYGAGTPVMVTQDQYDALPDSKNSDNIMYLIKDGSVPEDVEYTDAAANIFYDNSESGLEAENVQEAIDKLNTGIIKTVTFSANFTSSALDITSRVPAGYFPIAFAVTGGLASHTAFVWYNANSKKWNVSFRIWSTTELVVNGSVEGTLVCVKSA